MGVKHTVLPDGQLPIVAFPVSAQPCGPQDNGTDMDAALFTKNDEGRTSTASFSSYEKKLVSWEFSFRSCSLR